METFGGDVPVVHVSGLTGQGLPQLVETISLVAEMRDLRAEDSGTAQGYVLESKVDKGLGYVNIFEDKIWHPNLLMAEIDPSQLFCCVAESLLLVPISYAVQRTAKSDF